MGIQYKGNNKETSKAFSVLASFMFEQEFGEMKNFTLSEKAILKQARDILGKHA